MSSDQSSSGKKWEKKPVSCLRTALARYRVWSVGAMGTPGENLFLGVVLALLSLVRDVDASLFLFLFPFFSFFPFFFSHRELFLVCWCWERLCSMRHCGNENRNLSFFFFPLFFCFFFYTVLNTTVMLLCCSPAAAMVSAGSSLRGGRSVCR